MYTAMTTGSRELSTWKEIASHLEVNVRTAQKWERDRGLPIRRMGGARGRVYADTAALDAWKQHLIHVTNRQDRCYRWPLGSDLTVELRFLGVDLDSGHIELLCAYLNLLKTALP